MKVSGLTFLKWQNIYKIFSLCHTYQVTSCIKLFFIWFLREIWAAGNTGFKLSWQILLLKVIQINIEYHILTPLAPALWFICSILSVLVIFNFEICNLTLHFEHLSWFFYIYIYISIEAAFCYFQMSTATYQGQQLGPSLTDRCPYTVNDCLLGFTWNGPLHCVCDVVAFWSPLNLN